MWPPTKKVWGPLLQTVRVKSLQNMKILVIVKMLHRGYLRGTVLFTSMNTFSTFTCSKKFEFLIVSDIVQTFNMHVNTLIRPTSDHIGQLEIG